MRKFKKTTRFAFFISILFRFGFCVSAFFSHLFGLVCLFVVLRVGVCLLLKNSKNSGEDPSFFVVVWKRSS